VVVHIYGLPADVDHIKKLALDRDIALIEDSAEAHGQHLEGSPLGSFGTLSTFSFYSNKLITTGEGGMILTDDDHLAARARELRNLSFNPEQRFVHTTIGWNYRLTAMQAALGLSQLSRMDELLAHKQEIGHHYQELLQDVEELTLPLPSYRGSDNVYWVFGVVLGPTHLLVREMPWKPCIAVESAPGPSFSHSTSSRFWKTSECHLTVLPVSEWLGKQGFYLPNGADSTPETRVCGPAAPRGSWHHRDFSSPVHCDGCAVWSRADRWRLPPSAHQSQNVGRAFPPHFRLRVLDEKNTFGEALKPLIAEGLLDPEDIDHLPRRMPTFRDRVVVEDGLFYRFARWLLSLRGVSVGSSPLARFLDNSDTDLVYFVTPTTAAHELQIKPFVWTLWDLCHLDSPEFPEVRTSGKFEAREATISQNLRKAALVIVDSPELEDNARRSYGITV
jgi:hypothetical protein